MEKYIERKIKYNKSLKIDEEALRELDNLYDETESKAIYSVETENNIHYNFNNLDEFLSHDFSSDIKKLKISRRDYSIKNNLDIEFEIDYLSPFTVYGTIAEISYSTSDENIDILLREKISQFYKKNSTFNWIIGKMGLFGYLSIFIVVVGVITLIIDYINNKSTSNFNLTVFFIVWLIGFMLFSLIRKLDNIVCRKWFKPIIYYIGKQKEQWNKIAKTKSNIFWGIIIAIIVGIVTTAISNLILK